jgi:hypothetical protein
MTTMTGRPTPARLLFALLLAALLVAGLGSAARASTGTTSNQPRQPDQAVADDESLPVETFSGWTRWFPLSPAGYLDLKRCRMLIGDTNGNGLSDLICAYDYGDNRTLTLVQYSRTTSFDPWKAQQAAVTAQFDIKRCLGLHATDINSDGRDDLVCAYDYPGTDTRTFAQLAGDGSFSGWGAVNTGNSNFELALCSTIELGDVDGDGNPDLICPYNYGGARLRTFVQFGDGAGNLSGWSAQQPSLLQQFDLDRCKPIRVGDVTGDNADDLICAYDYGGNQTRTFVQLSSGSDFTGWTAQSTDLQSQFGLGFCRPLTSGDVNADGRLDLICAYDYGLNVRTFVQISRPDGYTPWISGSPPNSGFDLDLCVGAGAGDFDGDGHTDLACAYDYGNATTSSFVQRAAVFRAALPAVIR